MTISKNLGSAKRRIWIIALGLSSIVYSSIIFLQFRHNIQRHVWLLKDGFEVVSSNVDVLTITGSLIIASSLFCWLTILAFDSSVELSSLIPLSISGSPTILVFLGVTTLLNIYLVAILFLAGIGYFIYSQFRCKRIENIPFIHRRPLLHEPANQYAKSLAIAGLLVANLILVKAGYINAIVYPLNIDSVNHVLSILGIRGFTLNPYYHRGFHVIIHLISRSLIGSVSDYVLIFGQLLQTIAPLSLFYPVYRITRNRRAAFLSIMIAGFGWAMPSQATSWGKYPTILAMVNLPFVFYICRTWLIRNTRNTIHYLLGTIIIISAIFIQTRILFLIIGYTLIFKITSGKTFGTNRRLVNLLIGATLLIISTLSIALHEQLRVILIPYFQTKYLLISLVILIPFGIRNYAKDLLRVSLLVALTLILLAIPAPQHLTKAYGVKTLIDVPFLSIFLYIPFTLVLGMGYAGIENELTRFVTNHNLLNLLTWGVGSIIMFSPSPNAIRPVEGTNFVSANDSALFQYLEDYIPSGNRILIPNYPPMYEMGLDGGAWIEISTGRETVRNIYTVDLSKLSTYRWLCESGVHYIYIGNKPSSFSVRQVQQRPDWYRLDKAYTDIKLFEVLDCP